MTIPIYINILMRRSIGAKNKRGDKEGRRKERKKRRE